MKKIGIIVNWSKERAFEALQKVTTSATALGMEVVVDDRAAAVAAKLPLAPLSSFATTVEAVVVLGGDGTVLDAVKRLQGSGLPLMGLNIGSLGYLTCVGENEFHDALRSLAENSCTSDVRTTISAHIIDATGALRKLPDALNEIVVGRGTSGRLAWFNLGINGEDVATIGSDGIVVATPTGSTAYALASGGPLLLPDTRALVITAISPHALSFRPLVVPDTAAITISMAPQSTVTGVVTTDGCGGCELAANEQLELKLSPHSVTLLHHAAYSPCTVMNRKLGWGGR